LARKLPARYAAILMPLVLSIFMSCIVSLISTLRAHGVGGFETLGWLQAWGLSWVVAFPTLFLVLPMVRRIVAALVETR
jgi:hypothetical protein